MFALFVKLSYDLHLPALTGYIPQSTGDIFLSPVLFCSIACEFMRSASTSSGNFDGQGSGHEFAGTNWHPSSGYVNNCDGERSHLTCDVRQSFFYTLVCLDLARISLLLFPEVPQLVFLWPFQTFIYLCIICELPDASCSTASSKAIAAMDRL
jgi:hypothetical protein